MGADNLGQIHRWQHWRGIFETVPVAVFDRPPYRLRMLSGPAASAYRRNKIVENRARGLAKRAAPAWAFFASRLDPLSSTQIRLEARNRSGAVADRGTPSYFQPRDYQARGVR